MNFVHKNGTLHNDLSSQNILLHREGESMYIGVCDWGLASSKTTPPNSLYGYFRDETSKKVAIKEWVVQKLFILSNLPTILYSEKIELFSVAKLC
jgi:serine/threonine protein kinase